MRLNSQATLEQTLDGNPSECDQPYRTISLTQGQVALVDPEDYAELARFKWYAQWDQGTKTFYAVRNVTVTPGKQRRIFMHRIILNAPDGIDVDHRDLNSLNNRQNNLRLATRSQNLSNRKRYANNKSGLKGVCFHKLAHKWCASIRVANKKRWLGCFDTKEAASAAYIEAAKQLHGEFANW